MSAQQTLTLPLGPLDAPRVRSVLELGGFDFDSAPYAFFRARTAGCVATFYEKGKLVLQGADAAAWARVLDCETTEAVLEETELAASAEPYAAALERHPDPKPERWVGIDETGKGDYFGPLVVAAAVVSRDQVALLQELGVADSKRLSDPQAKKLAQELKALCPFEKVVLLPAKYNDVYARIGNLNTLLAWGHARALDGVLEKAPEATWALSDQFAKDPGLIQSRFRGRAKDIRHDQWPKAEADPAVAVASILARAEFLWQMDALSKQAGRTLPKGAGPPVLSAAKALIAEAGPEVLGQFAKLHFKTTQQLGIAHRPES